MSVISGEVFLLLVHLSFSPVAQKISHLHIPESIAAQILFFPVCVTASKVRLCSFH